MNTYTHIMVWACSGAFMMVCVMVETSDDISVPAGRILTDNQGEFK